MRKINQDKTTAVPAVRTVCRCGPAAIFILILIVVLAACADLDKGKDPVPPPLPLPAGYGLVTLIPAVNPELDRVYSVSVLSDHIWGESDEALSEGRDWTWDPVSREVSVTKEFEYPVFIKVTGRVEYGGSAGYYALATCIEQNWGGVAANEITTLIIARSVIGGIPLDTAEKEIRDVLDLRTVDPFLAAHSADRDYRLSAAMSLYSAEFVAPSQDQVDQRFEALAQAVVAGFEQDKPYGEAPLTLAFTDRSIGDVSRADYMWDFGDGQSSPDQHPVHEYRVPDPFPGYPVKYSVSLSVTQEGAAVSGHSAAEVYLFDPDLSAPAAAFSVDRVYGPVPLTIAFADMSEGDVAGSLYEWDFGDGASGSGPDPTHVYTRPGRYFARLTVIGPGGIDTASSVISAGQVTAVIATAASDFGEGAHSVFDADTLSGLENLLPTTSDITVVANGRHFYRIERYRHDNVTKFDISNPQSVLWQYSTTDSGEANSNPQDLVFAGSDKAYLVRYGATRAWIVDPAAIDMSGFKVGELDLSAYADQDGLPEMNRAVVVRDRLFIVTQRMNRGAASGIWEPNTAYIAVFDTLTDSEIDTGIEAGEDRRKGIPLTQAPGTESEIRIENPVAIQYLPESDLIYIQGAGRYSFERAPGKFTGGIAAIDPDTFHVRMVLDDGTPENHPYGNISGMVIASPDKGYFVGYESWENSTLYGFNPSTGEVFGPVESFEDKQINVLEAGGSLDHAGRVWISDRTDGGIAVLNPVDDRIEDFLKTGLPPLKTVFCVHE